LALVILENNSRIWRNKAYGFSVIDSNAHYMKQQKMRLIEKTGETFQWHFVSRTKHNVTEG
jgi:hypothetical protein